MFRGLKVEVYCAKDHSFMLAAIEHAHPLETTMKVRLMCAPDRIVTVALDDVHSIRSAEKRVNLLERVDVWVQEKHSWVQAFVFGNVICFLNGAESQPLKDQKMRRSQIK